MSTAEILPKKIPKVAAQNAEEDVEEATMLNNLDSHDTTGFSFQVDLLNLNRNLAEKEQALETHAKAHEAALVQIRTLGERH